MVELPRHARDDGEVVVAETTAHVPFVIGRIFVLRAPANAGRGAHAHKLCSQFMMCVNGTVDVECDDGKSRKNFALDRANLGLLVQPGIWTTVRFRNDAVVTVLCDRLYDADDYIRGYDDFIAIRNGAMR